MWLRFLKPDTIHFLSHPLLGPIFSQRKAGLNLLDHRSLTCTHCFLPPHWALPKPGGTSPLLYRRESIHLTQTVSSTRKNVKLSIGWCFLWLNFSCILLIYWYLLIKNVRQHSPGYIVINRYIEIVFLISLSLQTHTHTTCFQGTENTHPYFVFMTCHPGVVFLTNTYVCILL